MQRPGDRNIPRVNKDHHGGVGGQRVVEGRTPAHEVSGWRGACPVSVVRSVRSEYGFFLIEWATIKYFLAEE